MKPVTGWTELDEVAQDLAQGHPNLPGPLLLHFYNTVTGKCLFFFFPLFFIVISLVAACAIASPPFAGVLRERSGSFLSPAAL